MEPHKQIYLALSLLSLVGHEHSSLWKSIVSVIASIRVDLELSLHDPRLLRDLHLLEVVDRKGALFEILLSNREECALNLCRFYSVAQIRLMVSIFLVLLKVQGVPKVQYRKETLIE